MCCSSVLRLASSSLALVRIHVLDNLILSVSVQLLLVLVDLVLHQVVNPQTQSNVVEKHVQDHLIEVKAQIVLLYLERLQLFLKHLQFFVALLY